MPEEREITNTHGSKAESYDRGRPCYPEDFYEYVWREAGLTSLSVIADIGPGTGKVTRGFLERANTVYAVEPDRDMLAVLKRKLGHYPNCLPLWSAAESTGIPAGSVDLIFCGNSYHWFDRSRVIPEFNRIARSGSMGISIVIASLGPCENPYTKDYLDIERQFSRPVAGRAPNTEKPFQASRASSKTYDYTVRDDFPTFLSGALSASYTPVPGEAGFDAYCRAMEDLFLKYSAGGKMESRFRLSCKMGKVGDLAV